MTEVKSRLNPQQEGQAAMEARIDTAKVNEVVKGLVKELATTNAVNRGLLERLEKAEARCGL